MAPLLNGRPDGGTPPASRTVPGRASDGEDEPPLSKDDIFDILRASRRRGVVSYLYEIGESAAIGTLAEHIAAAENGVDVEALTSTQRKRVYIALYQCHLPKMADYGVIEYGDRGQVTLRPLARLLLPYLYLDSDHQPPGYANPVAGSSLLDRLRRYVAR